MLFRKLMSLTPEQAKMLPTDEDVGFYREHGYYISQRIFSDEEIEDGIYGMERYYIGERDFCLPGSVKAFEGWRPENGDVLRVNDYVSLQSEGLSRLARHPLLGAIAARLSGSATIRLWHDQMIYKPADQTGDKTGIGWHTDRAYWSTCSSDQMLTAWIPFHDCDESMGVLMVIDGSHQWSERSSLKEFHNTSPMDVNDEFINGDKRIIKVPMNLAMGQVSFHHCLIIHGSNSNLSQRPRLSLSVHMQDETNRYREWRDSDGKLVWHRNDMLCRIVDGIPDYTDPDFCPILWAADGLAR
jgi:ectoine hydroxylase-related dioxygenase (phytanoyl-CoA dioxygenase family)